MPVRKPLGRWVDPEPLLAQKTITKNLAQGPHFPGRRPQLAIMLGVRTMGWMRYETLDGCWYVHLDGYLWEVDGHEQDWRSFKEPARAQRAVVNVIKELRAHWTAKRKREIAARDSQEETPQ